MKPIEFVKRVSLISAVIAALALLVIVGVIMTEVVMRAMHTPLVGGIEIIRVTFLIAVFFAFAHVILSERDIRVDIVRTFLPRGVMRLLDMFASLVSAVFFGFMLFFAWEELMRALRGGVYMDGRLLLPMWLPWGTIVFGSFMGVLASLAMIFHYATRKPSGDDDTGPSDRTTQIS